MDPENSDEEKQPEHDQQLTNGKMEAKGPFPGWTHKVEPWPEPVDGRLLLDGLATVCRAHVVMPKLTPEASALFTVHTYAYHLRDVTAYLGIESPLKRW